MNLYNLHSKPETLDNFNNSLKVPDVAFKMVTSSLAKYEEKADIRKAIDTISKVPEMAYEYALYNLRGKRFKKAEPAIMKHPEFAYKYAADILNKPWPEAEQYIKQDSKWWIRYNAFIKNKG